MEANHTREQLAHDSLEMLIQWLKDGGNVGIHGMLHGSSCHPSQLIAVQMQRTALDHEGLHQHTLLILISGITARHRASIEARVAKEKGINLIFLESLCDDPAVIAANVALKVTAGDPDYKDLSPEVAKRDFLRRITEYEKVYETITEPHLSYLQIVNVGSQVTMSRINGYLQSRIAFYLMNLHLKPRSIYLSRVGDSFGFWKLCPTKYLLRSTAKVNSTSRARSVEIHCFQSMECSTWRPCLH